jgi:hypothetical protein
MWLAASPAWGHSFPTVRDVVVQVEPCEVVLLVGYRPGSGETTETVLRRAASAPKSLTLGALRDVLARFAMGPLTIKLDGTPLVPTHVRVKVGIEGGGARPWGVLLVSYALPAGHSLAISTSDPRSTRISWQDRSRGRVEITHAPKEDVWHTGVASFLLDVLPHTGAIQCATPSPSSVSSSRPAP